MKTHSLARQQMSENAAANDKDIAGTPLAYALERVKRSRQRWGRS